MTADAMDNRIAEGHRLLEAGQIDAGAQIFLEALGDGEANPEAAFGLGAVAMRLGQYDQAWEIAEHLRTIAPEDPRFLIFQGDAAFHLGKKDVAAAHYRQVLAKDPADEGTRQKLIAAILPGETYYDLLRRVHGALHPRTYIEVGVDRGRSLALAAADCVSIGIDPAPTIDVPFAGEPHIQTMTSDAFFADVDIPALLGRDHFDLAFVDGLHTFEQALKDVINLTRFAADHSVILVHDCYPLDAASCRAERITNIWSGDVWKVVCALRHAVPEIDLRVIKAPPTGLGLIRDCAGLYERLAGRYEDLVSEFNDKDYDWLAPEIEARLNTVANDWTGISALLARA